MRFFDRNFRYEPRLYILQCIMAAIAMVVTLSFIDVKSQSAILASLGSSCFVAFTMPVSYISRPRCLVGGYLIGIIAGCCCRLLCWFLSLENFPATPELILIVAAGLAVGLATFLMVITDTEHAPAAGLALGLVVNKWNIMTIIFIITGISALSITKELLLPRLRNLL
jgi:CBS-domain-containing membrane protein